MQAIITKYIGPTNTRGARIDARAAAGRIYVPFDHRVGHEENHKLAAAVFVAKYEWRGTWVMGCLASGDWAHVNTEA